MPQDARPSQRNEPNRRLFPPIDLWVDQCIGRTASSSANADNPVFQSDCDQLQSRGVLDTRFRGYDGVLLGDAVPSATQVSRCSRCRPKILGLQFDRRTVWRAIGGVIPGIAI